VEGSKGRQGRLFLLETKTLNEAVMKRYSLTVLLVCILISLGAVFVWATDSLTAIDHTRKSSRADTRALDGWTAFDKTSCVTLISDDCSRVVIGEASFVIGRWRQNGSYRETELLDSSGRKLKRCLIKPGDRVFVQAVARKDGALFALVIQKR